LDGKVFFLCRAGICARHSAPDLCQSYRSESEGDATWLNRRCSKMPNMQRRICFACILRGAGLSVQQVDYIRLHLVAARLMWDPARGRGLPRIAKTGRWRAKSWTQHPRGVSENREVLPGNRPPLLCFRARGIGEKSPLGKVYTHEGRQAALQHGGARYLMAVPSD
jgi:hypothetical protein